MLIDPVEAFERATAVLPDKSKPTGGHVLPTAHVHYQHAGDSGERALWVVFVIMVIATIAFAAMSWSVPVSKRLYHVITTLIVAIAACAYFGMASGHGSTQHCVTVKHYHKHTDVVTKDYVCRQVFWARYVDWSLTTPLLLLDLCFLAGMSGAHILIAVVADMFMILTGLFAAFGHEHTPQKWGWYAIACIAYLVVVWQLAVNGRSVVTQKGNKVAGFYSSIAAFTLILWTIYPIVWGFADGSRRVNVDGEIIAYAVLDVLAKPVFGLWLLLTHVNMAESHIDVGGWWSQGLGSEGTIRVGDDDGA